ncbi:MAG: SPOR domain-containing protein [Bacteroidales bacterium]|nr:SPOR domain-containing protein [Bacteroidales bacterium]
MNRRVKFLSLFFVLGLLIASQHVSAQTDTHLSWQNHHKGTLNIHATPLLYELIEKKRLYDSFNAGYQGYRVQIFFESGNESKQNAYKAADKFMQLFPGIPAFISFKEPNYRIRVGNFREKLDADRLLSEVMRDFSSSFVIKEFISIFDEPYSSEMNPNGLYSNDTLSVIRDINIGTDSARYEF